MVATHFADLCESMGESITKDEMVPLFVGLIKDSEGEVKILAIGQAPGKIMNGGGKLYFILIYYH
jgi:serine/threonine-protein phosphatase 2A regulatory subunit A